ncbi:cell envelope integrity EipB family protein [Acetobacteraceae bacterium H6797]|nr:cell envelope integrity EipB family protein [Acetobacteraceae bacterium H6797]
MAQQAPTAPAQPGAAAQPITLAAHRAAYTLTLQRARDGGEVADAQGAMLFEAADACEGWATHQRLTLTVTTRSGETVDTSSDYSTYEAKDGRSLRFSMVQSAQGAVSQRISGEAELKPDGSGVVRYVEPEAKEIPLPAGTLLPMMHTMRAIAAAEAGKRLMVAPLFDGTGDEGAQDSTTVIAGQDDAQPNAGFPALATLPSARFRIAFFERGASQNGASSPDYEVGLRYFRNGVADELSMDFGSFIVDGKLQKLELLPKGC